MIDNNSIAGISKSLLSTEVPEVDSISNNTLNEVLGNKEDTSGGTSLVSITKSIAEAVGINTNPLEVFAHDAEEVELNGTTNFSISLVAISVGEIPATDIDITSISAAMYKSHSGGAFSTSGVTQPVFTKANGLITTDYQFKNTEWASGDSYKLTVSDVTATVNGDIYPVRANIWLNLVRDTLSFATTVNHINTNVGDAGGDTLKSVVEKLGDDSDTVKVRFDTVDTNISTIDTNVDSLLTNVNTVDGIVDTINTNLGNPSTHTLTNITNKLGNDSNTIKQRFDTIDSTLDTLALDSTVMKAASYTAPDNASITTIKSDIENATTGLSAIKTAINGIPTNPLLTNDSRLNDLDATISSRLASSSYTAPDNTSITAIKNKTDNLPASPAAIGSAMTLTSAYDSAKTALKTTDVVVPTTNSSNNVNIVDVIGSKLDNELGNSIYALLYTMNKHFHSQQKCYPTLANGVTLTTASGGGSQWVLGNFVEIIPANTITSPFDLHWANVGAVSGTDTYEVVLYSGTLGNEVEVSRFRIYKDTNVTSIGPVMTNLIAANTRISGKVASATGGGKTLVLSLFYHTY